MEIDKKIIEENKRLVEKYPFLIPYEDENFDVLDEEKYDYSFTFLDEIPSGWKKCWGELLCQDLKEELERCNFLDKYKIIQMKEKYGQIRIYDNGVPVDCKVPEIITKYERISEYTCINCGAFPDVRMTRGWICPICKDCYDKNKYFAKGFVENTSENPFEPIITLKRYSKDEGETIIKYDITDIANRIKERNKK